MSVGSGYGLGVLWAAAWLTCCVCPKCPDTLPTTACPHCRAKVDQGRCITREENDFCLAECDDGFYATQSWVAKDKAGDRYPDGFECFCDSDCPYSPRDTECCWRNWYWDKHYDKGHYAAEDLGCTALCPNEAPVAHAARCPVSKQVKHGGQPCVPACDAGYTPSGRTRSYTCGEDSRWTGGDMVCSPVHCESRPAAPNALPCDAKTYGEQCAARCAPGYTPNGGGDTYNCAANGRWEGGSLECRPLADFCPAFGDFLRGNPGAVASRPETCDRTIDAECHAACDEENRWAQVSGSTLYKCTADTGIPAGPVPPGSNRATWAPVGDALQCQRRCAVDPPTAGAHFPASCDRRAGSSGECKAQCDAGYVQDGESAPYTCDEDAEWVGGHLTCRLTGCSDAMPLEHGTMCSSCVPGDKCQPHCGPGYTQQPASAEPAYVCVGHEWQLNGTAATCEAVANFCPIGPINGFANVQITRDCDGKVGSECVPSCTDGSEQVGGVVDAGYQCQPDKTWKPAVEADPLVCERTCDAVEPVDPHTRIEASCRRSPRSNCLAECAEDYRSVGGSAYYRCGQSADGSEAEWQGGSLECVAKCYPGFAPINVTAASSDQPCAGCDLGRFSYNGEECLECPEHNEDRSRCLRCPERLGPNPDKTVCEVCADRQLVSVGGVCKPGRAGILESLTPQEKAETVGIGTVILLVGVCLIYACCRCNQRYVEQTQAGVLRASFLGGTEKLPVAKLTQLDVAARWAKAEEVYDAQEWSSETDSVTGNPTHGSLQRSVPSGTSSAARRQRRGVDNTVHVMFTNDHVRELQPARWQQRPLGQGSFGVVYKVTWRGREVAVKVLKLPERTEGASAAANEALRGQVEEITKDFITEVEVCCDLNHPNLVRLLGYADRPKLMIMQELLQGNSMDRQLYVEKWRPTRAQVLKAAHDVARGMEYLHTMFVAEDNSHTQPIIHRDLKTPNLMLANQPADGEQLLVKVTDFGLSRDKALNMNYSQTVMMTGCGSVLWMAPEILLGNAYNEKVDVFSYAMCLLELVDCNLPWFGTATTGTEVPLKVTRGQRPSKQLKRSAARVDPRVENLICDCWAQDSSRRPDFTTIILRLEEIMDIPLSRTASRGTGDEIQRLSGRGGSFSRGSPRRTGGGSSSRLSQLEPVVEVSERPAAAVASRPASPDASDDRDPEMSWRE
eukprot:COSAG02_NODE_1076_length_14725_cov_10.610215_7_plen_1187_part_00